MSKGPPGEGLVLHARALGRGCGWDQLEIIKVAGRAD